MIFRMHYNLPTDAYSVAGDIHKVGLLGADMSSLVGICFCLRMGWDAEQCAKMLILWIV